MGAVIGHALPLVQTLLLFGMFAAWIMLWRSIEKDNEEEEE